MSTAVTDRARRPGALSGVRPLLAVTGRQSARGILPWIAAVAALSGSSILAYRWIFPDAADRQGLAAALGANPALELIFGPARDLMTADGFNAWRAGQLGALFAALMTILLVVRSSRADEDSGQAELIASGVITRQGRLLVPVLLAAFAAIAMGAVCFLVTWACGGGVAASAVLSAGFTGIALFFTGVAIVAAQLGSDARTANGLALAAMGIAYLARGYLDSSGAEEWTRWLTPFGWLEQMGPASENSLWPLLAFLAAAGLLVILALVLQQHRDFGLGVISPRPGRAEAVGMGIGGLAWRLHRGPVLTWMIAFAVLGLVFGNLAVSIGSVFAENPAVAAVLASGATTNEALTFGFVATILQLAGIIAAVMGAQVVMRLHAEEVEGRIEPLLAAAVRRPVLLGATVAMALAAEAAALFVVGSVLGLVAAHDGVVEAGDVLAQAVVTIPSVWVLTAVAAAAVGARPAARLAGWLVIVATFGITLLGPTFKFPEWALDISPMHHVPTVTAADPSWTPLLVLLGIAAVLVVIALAGFRRRDLL